MIAYRAETAMGNLIANECGSLAKARALLRDLFVSEADILPDHENKILMVRVHNLSTNALNKKLDKLIEHLNSVKMILDSHAFYQFPAMENQNNFLQFFASINEGGN
jgi:Tfp pilus assembly PilM family ATPase